MPISVSIRARAEVTLTKTLETERVDGCRVVLHAGIRILTYWTLGLFSSPPIIAQSHVAGGDGYAQINACGGCIPCLDKIACIPCDPFSNDGSSISLKCVTGRQSTQGEQRIFILSSNQTFVFIRTCRKLSTTLAHVSTGIVRALEFGTSCSVVYVLAKNCSGSTYLKV